MVGLTPVIQCLAWRLCLGLLECSTKAPVCFAKSVLYNLHRLSYETSCEAVNLAKATLLLDAHEMFCVISPDVVAIA